MGIKVWLDDEREPPDKDWVWFDSAWSLIEALEHLDIEVVSLDHDLGDDNKYGTGYAVVQYVEQRVHNSTTYKPPCLLFHTANPVGYENMCRARDSIDRELERRLVDRKG